MPSQTGIVRHVYTVRSVRLRGVAHSTRGIVVVLSSRRLVLGVIRLGNAEIIQGIFGGAIRVLRLLLEHHAFQGGGVVSELLSRGEAVRLENVAQDRQIV